MYRMYRIGEREDPCGNPISWCFWEEWVWWLVMEVKRLWRK